MLERTSADFAASDRFERIARLGLRHMHPGGLSATRKLLTRLALQPDHRVLDVGCGVGATTCLVAARHGGTITGVDRSPFMIARARERGAAQGGRATFQVGDAYALDFEPETFDALLAESVTLFLDCQRALPEFRRVLKPGGVVGDIVMTCAEPVPEAVLARMEQLEGVRMLPRSEMEWRSLYEQAGFRLRFAEFRSTLEDSSGALSFLRSNGLAGIGAAFRLAWQSCTDAQTRRYFREVGACWKENEHRFGYGLIVAERA